MYRPNLERMDVEFELLIAQRRASDCSPFSPASDAAMGLVDDLEDEIRRLDAGAHPRTLLSVSRPQTETKLGSRWEVQGSCNRAATLSAKRPAILSSATVSVTTPGMVRAGPMHDVAGWLRGR